jgi:hypothetical protein
LISIRVRQADGEAGVAAIGFVTETVAVHTSGKRANQIGLVIIDL